MTSEILFVTHAEVAMSAAVPVPDWPLTARGRQRHRAHAEALRQAPPARLWCSTERKARDAAAILSRVLGRPAREAGDLGENDRSTTGYLPPAAFDQAVTAFFGAADNSFQGWETARAAQARIVAAIDRIAGDGTGSILVLAHGGVGALLLADVLGRPISRATDQPGQGGGNAFRFTWPDRRLLHGWQDIAPIG